MSERRSPLDQEFRGAGPPGAGEAAADPIRVAEDPVPNCPDALRHALATLRLAATLGVRPPSAEREPLPYSDGNDNLVFAAPLTSLLLGRRMFFLRGWSRYESLVKGFNALGLLAEHAALERRKIEALPAAGLRRLQLEFLSSRRVPAGARGVPGEPGRAVFSETELARLPDAEIGKLDASCLALWKAFAARTIVCSTSSNMGLSLHQALLELRAKELSAAGKRFPLLNPGEGKLLIWCPDERADFMSLDKAASLRALAAGASAPTSLRFYVNRRERDPGALKDALACGGYFFPTNPQSRAELQNLLALALQDLQAERGVSWGELLRDGRVRRALESLGAEVAGETVLVRSALEGGMMGMAAPYLCMLEEALLRGDARALCVWNPASIGAALAAMALADAALRRGAGGFAALEPELSAFLPKLAAFLREGRVGRDLDTRIHGVFDIANLQSLAQLFGVVIRRHLSGRQTAYVGLGSSSYASGNLCFDILRENAEEGGAFRGRGQLHPATHTLNPLAQALVYAEDLARVARSPGFEARGLADKVRAVRAHCRKPEPAGAAALAGCLLARLDAGTLSSIELAGVLRAAGFTKALFLEFSGFGEGESAAARYIRRSGEEGPYMEALARGVLEALDRDPPGLSERAAAERAQSRLEYRWSALDDDAFEAADPAVHINLTGDNCPQPSPELVEALLRSHERAKPSLEAALREDSAGRTRGRGFDAIAAVKRAHGALSRLLALAQKGLDRLLSGAARPLLGGRRPRSGGGNAGPC